MKAFDTQDENFHLAESFVNQTNCNVFLTGKAGSGKTTFLHHITRITHKKYVVVAPTGVAAINAGGMTLHSFFQLPIGMFIPGHLPAAINQDTYNAVYPHRVLLKKIRLSKPKRKLMQQLELLIIDEVSMVRADVMDAVDVVLKYVRKNYREPFGGVQVLMIGDLYQLPPVVTDADRQLLHAHYDTPYFFSSAVISGSTPVAIQLEKIHRQSDEKFINLLNKVRHNRMTDTDLESLNRYYDPGFRPEISEKYITLCSHHYKADTINDHELKNLPGKSYEYEAIITGEFNDSAIPAEKTLVLKKGSQIMFVRNDTGEERRYFNGKIGIVQEIDKKKIGIGFPGEEGILFLERITWKNIRYTLDEATGNIVEKELGSFSQFPVRLAWAITIHKSQGLTFEKAIIDAGDSFTSGQVYVALSRLRNLEGLVLRTQIGRKSIIAEYGLDDYVSQLPENPDDLLDAERKKYLKTIINKSMDWQHLCDVFQDFVDQYRDKEVAYREEAIYIGKKCLKLVREQQEIADKFRIQALKIYDRGEKSYPLLSDRMNAAYDYFSRNLEEGVVSELNNHYGQMSKRSRMRKYLSLLLILKQASQTRLIELGQARDLFKGLAAGTGMEDLLSEMKATSDKHKKESGKIEKPPSPQKGDSHRMSLEMYNQGKTVEEIARERMLHPGTIESHLVHFILEGKLDVLSFVSEEKYRKISPRIEKNPDLSLVALKQEMGDQYSYNEIRAVMNHLTYLKQGNGS